MNLYFIGMCIAMAIFLAISYVVSKKIKDANDFYVAGRNAPLVLIAGSMVASYTSTGMFMGDAATCYDGALAAILLFAGMQSAGYIIGAVFFGRYLRRSGAMTIPEFFGNRFCSKKMQMLAGITAIIMMTVYLLSVVQGIGTLMNVVTGINYNVCIIIAVVALTVITVVSGSRGVLITDTLMASLFTATLVVSVGFIAKAAGGWFSAIGKIASNTTTNALLSWAGKPGALYDTGIDNVIWGLAYGIVWMSVCAVGPWQSSRYIMAKDEHTIIRSAPIAALCVFALEFFAGMAAVLVSAINPDITPSSHVMIRAAMDILPKVLGVVLMTGVLSAGISSATTFLSLIGASMANDILPNGAKHPIRYGRIVMVAVSAIVLICALVNPPAIFVIMFLGGATAASSWMPVAFGCIFSKRMTKTGAFCGMLGGMLGCLIANLVKSIGGIDLPSYLDPSIIGIACNIIAIIIGSVLTRVTDGEKKARAALFVVPDKEKDPLEIRKTLKWSKGAIGVGVAMMGLLLGLWAVPYLLNS